MQFFTWMKRNYIDDPTVKGTLARRMKDDSFFFPKQRGHDHIRKYLICSQASDSCLEAFEECWKEYKQNEI
ncbi:YozE family protein [Enterococcus faecalis]|uniref:YozE family protein n=1 Tax=Enterococcus faecalis TaxID=1351 RepID=UPI00094EBBD8|nr:YozE family protein [Enterococcus faecalis]EGO5249298.1 hypothetical protein [Enterococcus faecalis]EGO8087253.1 hypothetical protein [Enterococcus faecalis]EGO8234576.1 hypothetical protein [Enterococcus faecalis]EGO8500715.1 hypothetical protein [Enterococcus faecalis]MBO6355082.1 hypothetical protein [Enterococcus faecalis]